MTTRSRSRSDVIPESHRDLLEEANIGHLATARADGALQSNPVWFEWDGDRIKLSQTKDRQKVRNIENDPHVALSVTDPENPYRYLEVRGVVDDVEDDPRHEFLDALSRRYMGKPYPYSQPGDERIVIYIRPEDTSSMAA